MLGIIKKMFIALSSSIVNASNHTKFVLLSNQKCDIQPTPINLHPNEYRQEVRYCPFAVKLDRCVGSCNTLNGLSNKVCVPNKTEDLNLSILNLKLSPKDNNEEKKLMKKKQPVKQKKLYFTCLFISYHYVIDSC